MKLKLPALALLGAAACVGPASAAETIRVTVAKLAFAPAQVTAHVGDTIEWANTDFIAHTATSRGKDWDVAIPAKGSGNVILTHAGEVDYVCRFHPNMTGHITVAP
jgi:plastocyanin